MNGKFVVIEGPDCAGKSTVINGLRQRYPDAVFVADPGSTSLGNKLRELLKYGKEINICSEAELLLFTAVRSQLVNEIVIPMIERGKMVICDRYIHSTCIYQNVNLTQIFQLHERYCRDLWPDITIVFDIDYDTYLARKNADYSRIGKDDRFENDVFMKEVIERYHRIGGKALHIDATFPIDVVMEQVIDRIEEVKQS